jgi:hypothetical protein
MEQPMSEKTPQRNRDDGLSQTLSRSIGMIKEGRFESRGNSGYYYIQGKPKNRRLIISGKPNMGKTTSLATFDKPHMIINAPGEQGIDSIPRDEGITAAYFQQERGERISSVTILEEFMYEVHKALNEPDWQTVSIDGAHKLYDYFLDVATNGAFFKGMTFDSKLYAISHTLFDNFMANLFYAQTPVIVLTTWCEREYLDPDLSTEQKKNQPRYMQVMFPGKMATHFMGLVNSGAVHADITSICNMPDCPQSRKREMHYTWQLRPDINQTDEGTGVGIGYNRDCGFKLPRGKQLPTLIHQDYQHLKKLLDAAWEDK